MTEFDDDDDFDVLEYARSHGLCIDYTSELQHAFSFDAPSHNTLIEDLRGPSDDINANVVDNLIKERLTLSKDAASLLRTILTVPPAQPSSISASDSKRDCIRRLKQELPILSTDPDLDVIGFGSVALPDLQHEKIPFEVVNEENDEGFQWPTRYFAYPSQVSETVKHEKLVVPREALVLLQQTIRDDDTKEDAADSGPNQPIHRLKPQKRHMTPPLLTFSPPPSTYMPSSPDCHLPLVSDSGDSVAREARALEVEIMHADSFEPLRLENSDLASFDSDCLPHWSSAVEHTTTPTKKRRAEDLKVDGPLTPPLLSTSPFKKLKFVSFAPTLQEYIPDAAWWHGESDDDYAQSIDINDYDDFFDQIRPVAEEVDRKLENEQLSNADTNARVDIPTVDFTPPVAPWNGYSQRNKGRRRTEDELASQMRFIQRVKREDLKTATTWHGLSALERELVWSILTTKVSSLNLAEKVHGEGAIPEFLHDTEPAGIVSSESLTWKPEGLRILDREEDEEELEVNDFEEQNDVDALVRKRKRELEEAVLEPRQKKMLVDQQLLVRQKTVSIDHKNQQDNLTTPIDRGMTSRHSNEEQSCRATKLKRSRHSGKSRPPPEKSDLMLGGFSAKIALQKYMELRGKPALPEADPSEKSKTLNVGIEHASKQMNATICSREWSSDQLSVIEQNQASAPTAPNKASRYAAMVATLPANRPSCSIMISSIFLQRRHLLKDIEQLCPSLDITYRDYTLLHSSADEADMLLSPSTGLIISTLQQVKQRALPGQRETSPLRMRIAALSLRCERLVVLISEGLSHEMEERGETRPEDPRDQKALKQLESFASQLEGEVLLKYVEGGEKSLAIVMVAQIAAYSLSHGSADIGEMKPLAGETTWEIFLRRVGFNPFAAQIIVEKLSSPFEMHVPVVVGGSSPHQHEGGMPVSGLPAFLMMSEEQRVRHFQTLLGGSRIIKGIGRVLDKGWVSAAHGYKM